MRKPPSTPPVSEPPSRLFGALRLGALVLAVGAAFVVVASSGSLSSERVRDWVDGYGAAAPLVFIALSALLTVCLFPGPLLAGASGLLFGTALGFPVSLCAAVLGACAAFAISRFVAGDAVAEIGGERVRALRDWIGRRGFISVLYARIAPGIPYSLVNYAAGLTAIPLRVFAAATAVGAAPRAFAYTALGGSLDDLGSPEAIIAIAVLVVMAIAGLVALRPPGSAGGSWFPAGRRAGPP